MNVPAAPFQSASLYVGDLNNEVTSSILYFDSPLMNDEMDSFFLESPFMAYYSIMMIVPSLVIICF